MKQRVGQSVSFENCVNKQHYFSPTQQAQTHLMRTIAMFISMQLRPHLFNENVPNRYF